MNSYKLGRELKREMTQSVEEIFNRKERRERKGFAKETPKILCGYFAFIAFFAFKKINDSFEWKFGNTKIYGYSGKQ